MVGESPWLDKPSFKQCLGCLYVDVNTAPVIPYGLDLDGFREQIFLLPTPDTGMYVNTWRPSTLSSLNSFF